MRLPPLPAQAKATTTATPAEAFAFIVPVDLTRIFTGWGPLPAVVRTTRQTGAWDAAGQTRTVHLSDGSHAQEELTDYAAPDYFAYTVTPQTGLLSLLARQAHGEWWFTPQPDGKTLIRWHYEFCAAALWSWPMLLVVGILWQLYMQRALRLAVEALQDQRKTGGG